MACRGLFYALLGLSIPASAAGDLWPLRLEPPAITGTFMEPRSAHFHSGLDIRTGGRIGVEVQAPVSGWIERLRTSPKGYGKAIYLRADDGRTFVFAHLSAFALPLQERITAEWTRTRRYQMDVRLASGELRVAAGELIALSGATGTGAPHLHVEIRDAAGRPMNPLLQGLEFVDDRPPRITALRLVALAADSWIEGDLLQRDIAPGESLRASGLLGVEIRCADYAPNARFPLMPHAIELTRDGLPIHSQRQDSFTFAQSGQMRLEIRREADARWIRLHLHEQNSLPGRDSTPLAVAADGRSSKLVVTVRDAQGNEASAGFTIIGQRADDDSEQPTLRFGERHLQLSAPHEPGSSWRLRTTEGERLFSGSRHRLAYSELPMLPHRWAWIDADGQQRFEQELRGSFGGRSGRSEWSEWLHASDAGGAFFDGGLLQCQSAEAPAELPPDGEWVGPALSLRPHGIAFDGELRLSTLAALPADQGLFLRDRRGKWALLEREGDSWLLPEEGLLALLRDARSPRLGSWRLASGRELSAGDRLRPLVGTKAGIGEPDWPSVILPLSDGGAGLDADGIVALLDGRPWPARWDPEDEFVAFDFFVDPGAGEHELELRARDRLGNAIEARLRIELARP